LERQSGDCKAEERGKIHGQKARALPERLARLQRAPTPLWLRYSVPQDTEGKMPANFVLRLAIGLALVSSSAGAQAPCDAAALNGRYVFTGRGFIEAVQPGIQRMHYGVFVFDGAGKLTGKQSSSRGGKIGREKLEGSYTLDADCTGTLTLGGILAGQTHWDLYLTEDRKRGHIIRMDEGNMAVRSFER
jgi:hypothetical protein